MRGACPASRLVSVLALLVSTASLAVGEQPPPPPPLPATGLLLGRSEPTPVPGIEPRDFETLSAPPASASFAGLGDSNTQIPPDTHGAAGGGYLMETLNTHVRVRFASDGSVAFGPTPLNLFWSPVNADGADVFGPRVVYDPWAKRWIVAACDEAVSASSRLLVGVSRTEVPDLVSPNWYQTSIDVDPGTTPWADYPSVGFSAQWVVVQVNVRRISDGGLERSHLYGFDKAAMYAGSLTAYQRGIVDDPSGKRSFALPSIAVNKNDDVLLGYSRFEDTEYAGASYSFRTTIDLPNTMRWGRSLKDGLSCYYKDFAAGRNRWGDYSATVVDPADDLRMWTLQEDAAGSASLLRIDTTAGAVAASVALETTAQVVGAPSLDTGYDVIHAGGEAGVLYAVQLPF